MARMHLPYGTLSVESSGGNKPKITLDSTSTLGYTVYMLLATLLLSYSQALESIQAKDGLECAKQFQDAIECNIREDMRDELAPIVSAIRYAENGGKGREYGILHPKVKPTYRSQAGWCAATVQKNYDRWIKSGSKGSFIAYLGAKYCPIGADNDPTGLNAHWVKNVTYFYKKHLINIPRYGILYA